MSISRKRLRKIARRAPYWLLLALIPAVVAAPTVADDGFGQCKKCWTLKGFGAYVDPSDDEVSQSATLVDGASQRLDYSLGAGAGFGVAAEYHLNCRTGLEAALITGNLDSRFQLDIDDAWDMTDADIGFTAITLGPNFHLTPDSPVDFYIGPFLSMMQLDGEGYNLLGAPFNVDFDDELSFGVQAGLNVPFGETSRWAFHAAARYIDAGAEVTGLISPVDVDINPFIVSAGLAYNIRGAKAQSCVDEEPPPPPALPEPPEPLPPPPPAPKPPPPPPPPPPAPPAPKPEQRETVYFDSGSSRVSNIAKAILDEVALRMQQDSSLTAHIIGHSDSTGSAASNQSRSEGRAEASKSYLVTRHGIDPARITTVGMGSSEPVADNSTAEGRRANRRAEIVLKSN